jgi:hypothetical protein
MKYWFFNVILNTRLKITEIVPFLVITFGFFASALAYKDIHYLHWAVFITCMFVSFLYKKQKFNTDISFLFFVLYLNIVMVLSTSIIFNSEPVDILVTLFRYFLPFSLGLLLVSSRIELRESYYDYWYYLMLMCTILSYLQFFVSPTLWNLIPKDSSALFEGSNDQPFLVYMLYFRATSILGSPQVWAAFAALSILALTSFRKKRIRPLILLFLWVGAFLSGGKIAVLIFVMYVLSILKHSLTSFLYLAAFIGVVIISYLTFFDFALPRVIEHVTGFDRIFEEEKAGRLSIWSKIFLDMNLFLGGGPSYINDLDSKKRIVAESYILQTWAELTVIFPMTFIYLIARQIHYYRHSFTHIMFYGAVLGSTISSHAFSHPVFIVIWPLLMDHCKSNRTDRTSRVSGGYT